VPFWNCERCGARLYSAASTLRRQDCPVCHGALVPEEPAATGPDAGGSGGPGGTTTTDDPGPPEPA
jgi:hypothetical protein